MGRCTWRVRGQCKSRRGHGRWKDAARASLASHLTVLLCLGNVETGRYRNASEPTQGSVLLGGVMDVPGQGPGQRSCPRVPTGSPREPRARPSFFPRAGDASHQMRFPRCAGPQGRTRRWLTRDRVERAACVWWVRRGHCCSGAHGRRVHGAWGSGEADCLV